MDCKESQFFTAICPFTATCYYENEIPQGQTQ